MKFKWKIVLLCILVYIVSISFVAFTVTEQIYAKNLKTEINRCLHEHSNIYSSVSMYLIANKIEHNDHINIHDYASRLNDMLKTDRLYFDFYSNTYELIASSSPFSNDDITYLINSEANGRNYMIKWVEGKHYLIINDVLHMGTQILPFKYIKDITEVSETKNYYYLVFLQIGIVGLLIVAGVTYTITRFMLKPLDELELTAEKIAIGHYNERTVIISDDEIGKVANSFNMMASAVEEHIDELKLEDMKKQRFIDNLSHEMRTPLTAIIGYAQMLKGIKYDEKVFYKGLNYIHSEGQRLNRLFTTLTNLTLIRESELELEEVPIDNLLKEIISIMEPFTTAKDIKIIKNSENIRLNINNDLIKELLINLIENSIRASENGKEIIVGCKTDSFSTYIFVKDFGCGMSENEISRVLEPFYTVDTSRSRTQGGMGLGLAICHQIAEKHGAKIEIYSEINKGTEVRVIWS